MKLRTAYFCKQCDEEIDIKIDKRVYRKFTVFKCPWCNYRTNWGLTAVYEWKVPTSTHEHGIVI